MTTMCMKALVGIALAIGGLCIGTAGVCSAGDLEPAGPPAPTMRTLDSLGFDCPSDVANARSNLLFTFVTAVAGFNTAITISNTGADPFGTVPPACPGNNCHCTLNFYGTNAPLGPADTGNIAAGATYANVTSALAPNFQGYLIAACNFPYAHGLAFISDVQAQNLAEGYLAQVICTDRGSTAMGAGR